MSLHNTDYFKNHDKVGKFPWNIYHQPLENELKEFLKKIESNKNSGDILVIGCGLMNEMSILPKTFNYTLADIDKRIVNYWLEKEDFLNYDPNYGPGYNWPDGLCVSPHIIWAENVLLSDQNYCDLVFQIARVSQDFFSGGGN